MDNDDSQHDLKGIIIALLLGKMTKSTVEHCRTGIIYWIALKQLHATACHVCLEPFARSLSGELWVWWYQSISAQLLDVQSWNRPWSNQGARGTELICSPTMGTTQKPILCAFGLRWNKCQSRAVVNLQIFLFFARSKVAFRRDLDAIAMAAESSSKVPRPPRWIQRATHSGANITACCQLGTHSDSFHCWWWRGCWCLASGSTTRKSSRLSRAHILCGCVADLCLRSTGTWKGMLFACGSDAENTPSDRRCSHGSMTDCFRNNLQRELYDLTGTVNSSVPGMHSAGLWPKNSVSHRRLASKDL